MSQVECCFLNLPGHLIQFGPTLKVMIGFDPSFRPKVNSTPNLPPNEYSALIDTGATESCIDASVAATLGLPVVNQRIVSGAHGQGSVNVHLAQIHIPLFDSPSMGRSAAFTCTQEGSRTARFWDEPFSIV